MSPCPFKVRLTYCENPFEQLLLDKPKRTRPVPATLNATKPIPPILKTTETTTPPIVKKTEKTSSVPRLRKPLPPIIESVTNISQTSRPTSQKLGPARKRPIMLKETQPLPSIIAHSQASTTNATQTTAAADVTKTTAAFSKTTKSKSPVSKTKQTAIPLSVTKRQTPCVPQTKGTVPHISPIKKRKPANSQSMRRTFSTVSHKRQRPSPQTNMKQRVAPIRNINLCVPPNSPNPITKRPLLHSSQTSTMNVSVPKRNVPERSTTQKFPKQSLQTQHSHIPCNELQMNKTPEETSNPDSHDISQNKYKYVHVGQCSYKIRLNEVKKLDEDDNCNKRVYLKDGKYVTVDKNNNTLGALNPENNTSEIESLDKRSSIGRSLSMKNSLTKPKTKQNWNVWRRSIKQSIIENLRGVRGSPEERKGSNRSSYTGSHRSSHADLRKGHRGSNWHDKLEKMKDNLQVAMGKRLYDDEYESRLTTGQSAVTLRNTVKDCRGKLVGIIHEAIKEHKQHKAKLSTTSTEERMMRKLHLEDTAPSARRPTYEFVFHAQRKMGVFCEPSMVTRPAYFSEHMMEQDLMRGGCSMNTFCTDLQLASDNVTGGVKTICQMRSELVCLPRAFPTHEVPLSSLRVQWRMCHAGKSPSLQMAFIMLNRYGHLLCLIRVEANSACAVFESMAAAERVMAYLCPKDRPRMLIGRWWYRKCMNVDFRYSAKMECRPVEWTSLHLYGSQNSITCLPELPARPDNQFREMPKSIVPKVDHFKLHKERFRKIALRRFSSEENIPDNSIAANAAKLQEVYQQNQFNKAYDRELFDIID